MQELASRRDWVGPGATSDAPSARPDTATHGAAEQPDVNGVAPDQPACVVCREPVPEEFFTWPGCSVAHRLHYTCLSGMLSSLPGWPAQQPSQSEIAGVVRACVRDGHPGEANAVVPHLDCPVCHAQWTDPVAIAVAAAALPEWPNRVRAGQAPAANNNSADQPRRPALPSVFCERGREEMGWTTYRQSVPDPAALGGRRPGPWAGEFHCAARACGGTHRTPA